MNDKKLNENIEKIKQLLILPDYDKIDVGIELAVSLEEPRIFEELIDGCMLGDDRLLDRPILNHWMKETIISNGELRDTPTGYYIFLILLVNTPIESNVNDTLKSANINSLALKECYLEKIPLNIVNLKNLNYIDLSWNRIKEISVELCDMENLETLNVFQNKIKNIPVEINNLENLKILLVGNNILETIPGEIKLDNLLAFDFASNELVKYPDILNSFKNLKTVNFVNCSEGGDLEEKLNK